MIYSPLMEQKIKKLVPSDKRLRYMYMIDVERKTLETFQRLGYTPSKTIKMSIDKAWANSSRDDLLSTFIYRVWGYDS